MQRVLGDRKSAIGVSAPHRVCILTLPNQVAYYNLNENYDVLFLSLRGGADSLTTLH